MKLVFSERAWEDYLLWQSGDRKLLLRVNNLIGEIQRDPVAGIGKPERLRHALAGWWSRRISGEHRIVYRVHQDRFEGDSLLIAQLRYHY